jgi:hypothetical protein
LSHGSLRKQRDVGLAAKVAGKGGMMNSFPRAEEPVLDPILEEAKALRNKREPIGLGIAFHLVDIAAEQEGRDFVYQKRDGSCSNYRDDDNGNVVGDCLIGRVFEFFVDYSDTFGRCGKHDGVTLVNRHYDRVFTGTSAAFLARVQSLQDKGTPWGVAIDQAKADFLDELEG